MFSTLDDPQLEFLSTDACLYFVHVRVWVDLN